MPPTAPTGMLLLLYLMLQLALAGEAHANHAERIIQRSPGHPDRDLAQLSRRQAVSPQCGPAGGNRRCANNLCCSDYGYCGDEPDYCDVRWCQVQYGRCGDAPAPPPTTTSGTTTISSTGTTATATSPPAPTGTLVASTNGQCGNSTTCAGSPFGSCCSEYYWCGSGAAYCGAGCRGPFGTCGDGSAPLPPPASSSTALTSTSTSSSSTSSAGVPRPSNASTDGRCGVDAGRFTCTGTNYGPCCSDYGWCGDGPDYCTPLYCQADYGICG
ncbi:hypothetical protein PpBr36_04961 [Pyricularia pennisetigena]|uniref:hypothetical protein n=1 Tax=Pyricularia pennisetigena TaxID=1578925 RepID=UPI001154EA31|nr:hypothetical protein PpBr36_04961 [Pyricularia pennisetigena]TLS27126.1 hypothetical protein PpBr36_04961 [Pyricularia pennisetigena]